MIEWIPLDDITENVYQTRMAYDPAGIAELAADIAANGLLQLPVGRRVGALVQLAFGHRRWLAFRQLRETRPSEPPWAAMPVDLQPLTDEQMALFAWAENQKRATISPIEEATGIRVMLQTFGWTQAEAAAKLGMSRPTLTNKLRLLTLPEELLARLRNGDLSERQALAVMPAYALPDIVRQTYAWTRLERAITDGDSSEKLRQAVRQVINQASWDLHDYFPQDFPFPAEAGRRAVRCTACDAYRIEHEGKLSCLDRACMQLKTTWYAETRTHAASHETGLPVIDPATCEKLQRSSHFGPIRTDQPCLARALAAGCPHLHLAPADTYQRDVPFAHPEGYPEVIYRCTAKTCHFAADTNAAETRRLAQQIAIGRVHDRLNGKIHAALTEGRAWGALAAALRTGGKTQDEQLRQLADKIYTSIPHTSADPDTAAEQMDYWLAAHVTGHQPDHDLWSSLRRRWQSIAQRIGALHSYRPDFMELLTLQRDIADLRLKIADGKPCSDQQELSAYLPAAGNLLAAVLDYRVDHSEFAAVPDLVEGDADALTGALARANPVTLTYALYLVQYRGDQPRAEKIHAQIERLRANQPQED